MSERGSDCVSKRRRLGSSSPRDDPQTKVRRHRAKLTCIECKRRKIKCDKTYPCSACTSRGLAERCGYEDGQISTGAPSPDTYASPQHRLRLISAHQQSDPSSPAHRSSPYKIADVSDPSTGRSATRRAAVQEKAFSVLEDQMVICDPEMPVESSKTSADLRTANGKFWPNIVSDSTAKRSNKWTRDMLQVVEAFPEKARMDHMLDFYFTEVQIIRLHVHQGVFRDEIAQFENLRIMGMHLSVDPAWLAQLAAILWVTSHYLAHEPNTSPVRAKVGLTVPALVELSNTLFEAMETAHTCADWLFRPQFRVLQTVLIVATLDSNRQGPYYRGDFVGARPEWTRCMYFDVAVGICKGLALHTNLEIQDMEKLNDPGLPTNRPLYSVEVARRAFYTVLHLDTFTRHDGPGTLPNQIPYSFPPFSSTTVEPANYSDDALVATNPTRPRDPWEKTTFVWEYHMNKVTEFWRQIITLLRSEDLSYDTVMDQSQVLRDFHQNFMTIKATHDLNPIESDAFFLINSSYLQRLLRLHRPYILRSYQEPMYAHSQTLALSAARQIIRAHRKQLNENGSRLLIRNATYPYIHHISSILVLFIHALLEAESRVEIREEIVKSADVFHQVCLTGHAAHFRCAAKGFCLVSEMSKVIDEPPPDVYNMESIIRDIHSAAKVNQSDLLDDLLAAKSVNSGGVDGGVEPVSAGFWTVSGEYETPTEGIQPEGWNIDWGLFIRDL